MARLYMLATWLWAVLVFLILTLPLRPRLPDDNELFSNLDKLVHAALFGILYYLAAKAVNTRNWKDSHIRLLAIVTIYGVAIEGIQLFLNQRSFDVLDIIANIMGTVLVYFYLSRN